MKKNRKAYVEVYDPKTKEIVHTVETTESKVDRVQAGMSINMDSKYRMRVVYKKTKVQKPATHPVPRIELPEALVDPDKWDELEGKRTIRFRLGKEEWNWIDVRFRKIHGNRTVIELMAGAELRVLPPVTNVIHVKLD